MKKRIKPPSDLRGGDVKSLQKKFDPVLCGKRYFFWWGAEKKKNSASTLPGQHDDDKGWKPTDISAGQRGRWWGLPKEEGPKVGNHIIVERC